MKFCSRVGFLSPKWLAVSLLGACFLISTARAQTLTFGVELDGFQEVPPNSSPGVGDAELTLNTANGYVNIVANGGSYQDLLGNSSAVSINGPAGYGTNAAVILVLTLASPGTQSGTFSGNGTLSSANMTAMINTETYINVRSNVYPSGEIRGQIVLIPEPTSAALVCLGGLAGFLTLRRRRR
jgi:CHRD domain-containing protein